MDANNINQEIFDKIFRDYSIKMKVYIRGSKVKSVNFDKFRNVGYTKEFKNPIFVNVLTKSISPNSLIIRELGLTESGAVQVIVENKDLSAIKLCDKIILDNLEYTPFNQALGNRFQYFSSNYSGFSKIILFRINK